MFAAASSNFEVALRYCGVSVLFCIVFGGYVLSVDKLIEDVPWVGWIAVSFYGNPEQSSSANVVYQYTTPALYTYEAMMAAEFHNTEFSCASGSVVPSGPNYTDIAYQTCGYAGSQMGTTVVSGDDYLAAKYGFYFSNVWRNFGILCLFTVVYIAGTCWLSEVMEWEPDSAGPIQHRKSLGQSKSKGNRLGDEESNAVPTGPQAAAPPTSIEKSDQVLAGTQSTFTWDNLELNVKIGKESRKLLNGVRGYCKPGTLTALVGASGAGKSTCMPFSFASLFCARG